MYENIIDILSKAATCSYENVPILNKKKVVIGWNKYVRQAHAEARLGFQNWVLHGKPRTGPIYSNMTTTRKVFKQKLKWCQDHKQQIKMDILADLHSKKIFSKFWKETKKLNDKSSLPVCVEGVSESSDIAALFKTHFRVQPSLEPRDEVLSGREPTGALIVFNAKEIAAIVRTMSRGKSPGYDSLSIEHLQHAGAHLPRVLALLLNFCVSHSYLPDNMTKTVVVPLVKNKTGDAADIKNYRPISLATIVAKVLDSMLDKQLEKYLTLQDAQFGFKAGLSTETAVLCLKHTVRYYTDRKTPVFACFLDLSKAFDLVSYRVLWEKLYHDTEMPIELIQLFRYWYGHQSNMVRWANVLSDPYRLDCGVRQGGLTSPKLFNLYVDRLIGELSNSGVGCSIDGVFVNNISYADDMVLLSPSISGLRKLVGICERYAEAHGLRYNASKSELMEFKAGTKYYPCVPEVMLAGTPLKIVSHFKYLGHWVTETLKDDMDIERERRALAVRSNMLIRRFARCSYDVKLTLFRAYCQAFYTCSLWINFTQKAMSALRVQYNNGFRMLLGLPRFCSASGMFAEAHTDGFPAIIRKRVASLMRRVRGSSNSFLKVFAERNDGPLLNRLLRTHVLPWRHCRK